MKVTIKPFLAIFLVLLFLIPITVKADIGPKASLVIRVNYNTNTNIHVDLLKEGDLDNDRVIEHDQTLLDEKFYEYLKDKSFDGYVSAQIYRGAPYGITIEEKNDYFEVRVTYRYPKEFKVIVFDETNNKVFVTKAISQKAFDSNMEITIDYDDTKYPNITLINDDIQIKENHNISRGSLSLALRIVITILVEIFILFLFQYRNRKSYHIVGVTNFITQTILSVFLFVTMYINGLFDYIFFFIVGEIIVITIELLVYRKFLKEIEGNRYVLYALVANLATILLTFMPILN